MMMMMMNARRGLARQINYRLLLALGLAAAFSVLVGIWVFLEANQRAMHGRLTTLHTHLLSVVGQLERNWGREAYNYRARLEFTRILEHPATRATRLTGYFTAQGGGQVFPYVRILDGHGQHLFTYAYGLDHLPPVNLSSDIESAWVWDDASRSLFRLYQQPIWLGNGNGLLQLFKPADHALLNSFEMPDANIVLLWDDRPVASSLGEDGKRNAQSSVAGNDKQWVSWGEKGPGNPQLLIMPSEVRAFSPGDLALPLGIATLVFALAAWATLGRWSVLSLRRVQALRHAQEQFAEDRAFDDEIDSALDVARSGIEDEISDVADTLQAMMQTIVESEVAEIEARESMIRSEQRFRLLIEGTHAIAWEYDPASDNYPYISPQAESVLGYPLAECAQPGFIKRLLPEDNGQETLQLHRRLLLSGTPGTFEYQVLRKDGRRIWLQDMTSPIFNSHGALTQVLGLTLDITTRKQAEERLILSDLVVQNAGEGVIVCDADNNIISVNAAFEQITGYARDEVIGRNPSLLKSGLQDAAFYQRLWAALRTHGRWSGELWNRRKTGELYAQRASIVTVPAGSHHGNARYVALFSDFTVEKQQEEELAYQAGHDPLTSLPNRRLLSDRLESALARARRDGTSVGMLLLDLDGFKHINDTLGHQMGDQVLVEMARRIQHGLRETDTLARIGGDEFMIVVEGLEEQNDLQGIATKVLEHVEEPLHIDHAELYVTTSIGITVFPGDGHSSGELFANADTALYRAKAEGRNAFRFFTAQMHLAAMERMGIETELRRGIPNREFVLHYQPVIELATGRVAKAEALVRWEHPERGLVQPNDFIPIAEDTGLILPLGAWIVGEAARQASAWDQASPDGFKICVNFSAYQFRRSDPIALLTGELAASGIGSGHLTIEITESLFMEDEGSALSQLHQLREQGFEIAIDDFGTGYSSLSYLQRLPVDTLKIDRSFVMGIPDNPRSMALIDAMISLGHSFGIAVVAEGIETEAQADFLQQLGCKYGQGYLFSKPISALEFARKYFPAPPA